LPRSCISGVSFGSSPERIAIDQLRSGLRSGLGMSSRLPITSIGICAAKSAMKSTLPFCAISSSSASTRRVTCASMRAIARWLTAPMIRRRTRVCRGGSLNTRLVV
jgi:hypothetical protein